MPPATPANSEWLTRKVLIDSKLKAAGWRVAVFVLGKALSSYNKCAIEEFPTASGPADYALCLDGQIVGIVEVSMTPFLGHFFDNIFQVFREA